MQGHVKEMHSSYGSTEEEILKIKFFNVMSYSTVVVYYLAIFKKSFTYEYFKGAYLNSS